MIDALRMSDALQVGNEVLVVNAAGATIGVYRVSMVGRKELRLVVADDDCAATMEYLWRERIRSRNRRWMKEKRVRDPEWAKKRDSRGNAGRPR